MYDKLVVPMCSCWSSPWNNLKCGFRKPNAPDKSQCKERHHPEEDEWDHSANLLFFKLVDLKKKKKSSCIRYFKYTFHKLCHEFGARNWLPCTVSYKYRSASSSFHFVRLRPILLGVYGWKNRFIQISVPNCVGTIRRRKCA